MDKEKKHDKKGSTKGDKQKNPSKSKIYFLIFIKIRR